MAEEHKYDPVIAAKVEGLACVGIPFEKIARHVKLDMRTVEKYYGKQLHDSLENKIELLGGNLFMDAVNGCKQSREFWLKTRARYAAARPIEEDKLDKATTLLEKIVDKL